MPPPPRLGRHRAPPAPVARWDLPGHPRAMGRARWRCGVSRRPRGAVQDLILRVRLLVLAVGLAWWCSVRNEVGKKLGLGWLRWCGSNECNGAMDCWLASGDFCAVVSTCVLYHCLALLLSCTCSVALLQLHACILLCCSSCRVQLYCCAVDICCFLACSEPTLVSCCVFYSDLLAAMLVFRLHLWCDTCCYFPSCCTRWCRCSDTRDIPSCNFIGSKTLT